MSIGMGMEGPNHRGMKSSHEKRRQISAFQVAAFFATWTGALQLRPFRRWRDCISPTGHKVSSGRGDGYGDSPNLVTTLEIGAAPRQSSRCRLAPLRSASRQRLFTWD